ncbi:DUF2752 domain-containing protein [Nocardioides sp. TF02-7]|uniref:DUF2752 domain-containing protein n=1 Tax=Nocardioides sp. TF02-7 TaxID=2917724 RepID=UPI001F06003D|nr:DUF2752 domain-containing protein [Nocardioides sp. TF02-7]UMG92132.1 DUF2752 domain-containing protein [Nocardioides sp. TF02-7]
MPTAVASRGRRLVAPALVTGGLAAAVVALHLRDPHDQGSWGVCPSYSMFGIYCPGCGGLRGVNDLSNLRLVDAASSNLVLVVVAPFVLWLIGRWALARWRGERWELSATTMNASAVLLAVGLVVFTVLRNTTAGSWLAP